MSGTSPLTPEQLAGFREELEAELHRPARRQTIVSPPPAVVTITRQQTR